MKTLALITLFLLGLFPICAYAMDTEIGYVTQTQGSPQIRHLKKETGTSAIIGHKIYEGDVIKTDDKSSIEITFIDKTDITLAGKDGELTINQYVFDPENPAKNKAHYSILRASFEFIGGLIDKGNQSEVTLDFGSIGIRGTKFSRSMKDGECWIYLEEGKIDVTNPYGKVSLVSGEGTRMSDKPIPPAVPEKWDATQIKWIKDAARGL